MQSAVFTLFPYCRGKGWLGVVANIQTKWSRNLNSHDSQANAICILEQIFQCLVVQVEQKMELGVTRLDDLIYSEVKLLRHARGDLIW